MIIAVIVSLVVAFLLVRTRRKARQRRAVGALAEGLNQTMPAKNTGGIPRAKHAGQRPDTAKPARVGSKRLRWSFYNAIAATKGDFWQLMETASIICFVGPNGSGKTLAAVAALLPTLDGQPYDCDVVDHRHHKPYQAHVEGCEVCTMGVGDAAAAARCQVGQTLIEENRNGHRLVYSTVELLADDGQPHPMYRRLESFQQLVTIEHADLMLDEIAGVMDSGDSDKVPVQVRNFMHKLRHFENRAFITTPAYMRCAKTIRQVTQVVVDARSFYPERVTDGRRWKPMRAFCFRAFDAFEFEDYTSSTKDNQPLMAKTYFWRPGHRACKSYNSLGAVAQLGHVDESGLCMGCGGSRTAPRCTCPPDMHVENLEDFEVQTELRGTTRTKRLVLKSEPPTDGPLSAVVSL